MFSKPRDLSLGRVSFPDHAEGMEELDIQAPNVKSSTVPTAQDFYTHAYHGMNPMALETCSLQERDHPLFLNLMEH
jgi:hypothetical protein